MKESLTDLVSKGSVAESVKVGRIPNPMVADIQHDVPLKVGA